MKHLPKKHLGQHFLVDEQVIDTLLKVIAPKEGESFIEIGPGLGALTVAILPLIKKLSAIEIDKDVITHLQTTCKNIGELTIYQQDALTFDLNQLTLPRPFRIIGNLPYNISSPLLFHMMNYLPSIKDMHFMLQKEVVDRMAAAPGTKDYGRLSVMLQYLCKIQMVLLVPPQAFNPPPKVDSAIVKLLPYSVLPVTAQDPVIFNDVVKLAFGQRRKTLRNSLKPLCQEKHFEQVGIDSQLRAENLSVEQFVHLSNTLASGEHSV